MVHHLTLCALLCLAACSGKAAPPQPVQNAAPAESVTPPPPPKTKNELAMEKFESFATQMCTCVDKACADTVQAAMTAWATEMANNSPSKSDKPSEKELKRMTEVGQHYAECMTTAMTTTP